VPPVGCPRVPRVIICFLPVWDTTLPVLSYRVSEVSFPLRPYVSARKFPAGSFVYVVLLTSCPFLSVMVLLVRKASFYVLAVTFPELSVVLSVLMPVVLSYVCVSVLVTFPFLSVVVVVIREASLLLVWVATVPVL